MGLVKALVSAAQGVIADQWKEFFYCDAMPKDVLVQRGFKRTNGVNNNLGSDNIITNGSGIAVADGQCMMIVEQGQIVEVCAEPGEYTYDTSSEPSIFAGDLGSAIEETFRKIGMRFSYGGATGKDQRVYYFNTKELMDNKFGTPNPIPFRVVDHKIGMDIDVDIRCSGVYSYKIVDPLLFYTNVCGNVEREFTQDDLDTQLRTEFISALAPALGKLSEKEIRPSQLTSYYNDITAAMNEQLAPKWKDERGLSIVSIALNPISLTESDAERLKTAQDTSIYKDPNMAAAYMTQAQGEALKDAANNDAGAPLGFMAMGMAANAAGNSAADLFAIGQQNGQQAQQPVQPGAAVGTAAPAADPTASVASIGSQWTCGTCGKLNDGNFCTNCGAKKPEGTPHCRNCGFTPRDINDLPKFCPQCGTKFGE